MKKILLIGLLVMCVQACLAEGKLWVVVTSTNVNEVFFIKAKGNPVGKVKAKGNPVGKVKAKGNPVGKVKAKGNPVGKVKVDREWINEPAGYFYLNGSQLTRKTGDALAIAQLPPKYRKLGPGGVWEEMTPAEKAAVDAADKTATATSLAQLSFNAAMRELINETFGNSSKEITEQELIDRIKTKL